MHMQTIVDGVRIGIVATICVDLAALLAKHVLRLPTTDWALMGRWFGHCFKGVPVHRRISESAPIPNERMIGWIGHYLTGIVYAVVYLAAVRALPSATPSLWSAVTFGLVTLAAPWFLVQPSIGAGRFAAGLAHPWPTRLCNILMHLAFGVGLYAGWVLLIGGPSLRSS